MHSEIFQTRIYTPWEDPHFFTEVCAMDGYTESDQVHKFLLKSLYCTPSASIWTKICYNIQPHYTRSSCNSAIFFGSNQLTALSEYNGNVRIFFCRVVQIQLQNTTQTQDSLVFATAPLLEIHPNAVKNWFPMSQSKGLPIITVDSLNTRTSISNPIIIWSPSWLAEFRLYPTFSCHILPPYV